MGIVIPPIPAHVIACSEPLKPSVFFTYAHDCVMSSQGWLCRRCGRRFDTTAAPQHGCRVPPPNEPR